MGVIKKKPYEISIWEDRFVTENNVSYYKEIKLAVIGSDKMESPNRVFNPVLVENVNGEKTLTFSLAYRYYDEFEGGLVVNPFHEYLINERKVKLFYNDEWNEFVIKECEENSEENTFNYTAKELFSLELAKLGYNVTLDTELNNNQGTVTELAKKVLENTDWKVDEDSSDLLTQYVQEPLYEIELEKKITILNLDTHKTVSIEAGNTIYVFYNYIENKETQFVQFISETDRNNFFIDDDNVIKSINYRFTQPVTYITDEQSGEVTGIKNVGTIKSLYLNNQGYRLVYKIRTTYDPVMDRTVEIYKAPYNDSTQEIYHFLDYNYTTSDIVTSYITNGSNFELYEDGDLQGWYNNTPVSSSDSAKPVLQPIRVTTYPELASTAKLQLLDNLSELNGYIELKFNNVLTNNYENTYFNEGFEHNASIIDHISAGEKFALRTRYYTSASQHGALSDGNPSGNNNGLRAIVAKYETVEQECYLNDEAKAKGQTSKILSYKILPNDIILDFNGSYTRSINLIDNGVFNKDKTQYIVDNVVQAPSTAYVYKTAGDNTEYIWDYNQNKYINKANKGNNLPFADYYITTATAKQSFTNEQMADPKLKLGVFLYVKNSSLVNKYIYLQDIQLTRYYEDANHNPVTVGNAPTATSEEIHKFYLKPTTQLDEREVNTYGTPDALAEELGINKETIVPVYNDESEKILSIQASQSNYFNILQSLCETFECWLDIRVPHNEDGSITLDANYNPIKKIAFKEYAGKDNFAGFRNGINLKGITRNIDSNEIVTKLIVDPVQSEYSDTGTINIQEAKSNPSGQSYILNFSYYLNRGLITETREAFNRNLNEYYSNFSTLNKQITAKQKERDQISNSLTKIDAQRNTYTALIDEAEQSYNKAVADFQKLTNWEYETFVNKYQNIEDWAKEEQDKSKDYLENDTILEIVGQIYTAKITINNYTGILTNLNKLYQDLKLQFDGAKEYNISTTFIPGNGSDINPSIKVVVDDYISGLQFELWGGGGNTKFSVIYTTTPNDRIFQAYNANPYKNIRFSALPSHYQIKYYENNKGYILDGGVTNYSFNIYDNTTGETYSRRFSLVPDTNWAKKHKGLQQEIDELIEQKNQLEKEFYKKYSRFLQEGTWSSQDYIDSELYYFDALQVSDTSAQPKVNYTINVLEVSQIDGLENYDFRVGDKTYIEDPDFFGYIYQATDVREPIEKDEESPKRTPVDRSTEYEDEVPVVVIAKSPVREEVIVSEVEWHFDEPDNNTITVQNYKTRFEDLFQRISATVQTVQRNEITYPKTSSILDQSGLINSTLLANSLSGAGGIGFGLTTNGSVRGTEDGLLITDLMNPSNQMKLASFGLQLSTDGGNNWSTAIKADGISADKLTAGTINTQRIWLMDGKNPSFRWDKAGLNAYGIDENGNKSYDLKTYVRFDKYGLYGIKNGKDYVARSLSDVRRNAFFGITWDGFFIKNSYNNGGEVSITSEEDIVVKGSNGNKRIWIGAVEKDRNGTPTKYGINIMNDAGEIVFDTGDDGNVTISGTINAKAGMYSGLVSVGDSKGTSILIDGASDNPTISSSNYSDGAGTGWIIDSKGDAVFSNVSVRGAIKTAVFEYEEIQAVGGAFLFRPSSTIKTARYNPTEVTETDDEGVTTTFETYYHYDETTGEKIYNDLIVTVEKPLIFRKGNWVKISNYNELGENPAEDIRTYGLVHIYKVSDTDFNQHPGETIEIIGEDGTVEEITLPPTDASFEMTLAGGCAILDDIILDNVPGGALIDFGAANGTYLPVVPKETDNPHSKGWYELNGTDYVLTEDTVVDPEKTYYKDAYQGGKNNYGVGINSSDNYVNLPARAMSLFETTIHPNDSLKVTYNYRGILGTLPRLSYTGETAQVSSYYHNYLEGTQGIFTDNMYIGDHDQYLTFYTDKQGDKHLRINAREMIFGYDEDTGEEITWEQKIDDATQGEDAIQLVISSTIGNEIVNGVGEGAVYARLFQGGSGEIDPLKTTVFSKTPPSTGTYYYHLDSTNHTCTLKKKINDEWVNAPTEDQPRYTYTWTFRDESGMPINYGPAASVSGKAFYIDGEIIDGKIVIECNVSDGN